jgi:hypothetical protein
VLAKLGVWSWHISASIGSPETCSSPTIIADLVLRRNRTSGVLVQVLVRQTNSALGYLLLIQKVEGFCVKPPTWHARDAFCLGVGCIGPVSAQNCSQFSPFSFLPSFRKIVS